MPTRTLAELLDSVRVDIALFHRTLNALIEFSLSFNNLDVRKRKRFLLTYVYLPRDIQSCAKQGAWNSCEFYNILQNAPRGSFKLTANYTM